jgi:hypothetical protein
MEYWRLGVATQHEAEEFGKINPFVRDQIGRIQRYQTAINRQLYQAINQLERLQRLRKGDDVPPRSTDAPTISDKENSDQ